MGCNGAMNLSRLLPLICCLLLAACQQPPVRKLASAAPPGTAIQQLGPYRFAIPVDYYVTQTGPTPDPGMTVVMLLPDFGPLPPNSWNKRTHSFYMEVRYSVNHIDRVPIEAVLERATSRWYQTGDAYADNNPLNQLVMRPAALQLHGLTRHDVDPALFEQHKQRAIAKFGKWEDRTGYGMGDDWYIARDTQGRLRTFITCTPHQTPDGVIDNATGYQSDGSNRIAQCQHHFTDRQRNLRIKASYLRVHLAQWQEIEATLHELLESTELD